VIWSLFGFGTVLVLLGVGGWGRAWYTAWQRRCSPATRNLTAAEEALQRLHQEATDLFRPLPSSMLSVGVRLGNIIRTYLQTTYQIPAFALTISELAASLNGAPGAHDLLKVLEQCEALKYQQPAATSPAAEQELWWSTAALFETLPKDSIV
jgi:hypothetical protein